MMDTRDIITIISVLIGGTGIFGSYAAYRKSKPEAGKIFIDAAQGVVLMQTGVIESLKEEVNYLRQENARVLKENEDLKNKLDELEEKIKDLTRRTTVIEQYGTN